MQAQKVSEIVFEIKSLLESNIGRVLIEGEISNWSQSGAGHIYFSLSDDKSSLSAVLFRGDRQRNPLSQKIKNGDHVFCWGEISLYAPRGTIQVVVRQIFLQGEGLAQFQLELLKKKLEGEGLFRFEHKKKLPVNPRTIAIITAEQGAALQDFISVFSRRSAWGNLYIFPALMQGKAAAESIINALQKVIRFSNEKESVDCVVLTRGGGSQEDLFVFNDENLVRAVFDCPIPLVSAVGHEVDYTLVDYVADERAETPSAAAEMLSYFQDHFLGRLRSLQSSLVMKTQKSLLQLQKRMYEVSPLKAYGLLRDKLLRTQGDLRSWQWILQKRSAAEIENRKKILNKAHLKLGQENKYLIQRIERRVEHLKGRLDQFDTQKILAQGYAYVKSGQEYVASAKELDGHTGTITLCFKDGVREVVKNEMG